jgi:hypothetical protein
MTYMIKAKYLLCPQRVRIKRQRECRAMAIGVTDSFRSPYRGMRLILMRSSPGIRNKCLILPEAGSCLLLGVLFYFVLAQV